MSAQNGDTGVLWRSHYWPLGLLVLLGLAACGAPDRGAAGATSAEPHATEATAAGVSQATAGAPRQPIAATLDTSAENVQPSSPPTLPPGPSTQPTEAAKPTPAPLPPEPPNPIGTSATAPTADPAAAPANTDAWQTYRNDNAGYSIAYPPGWTVREQNGADGSIVTTFTPGGGGSGVTVIAQNGASNAAEPSDLPNTRCQHVTIGGLSGTRCLDTVSFSTSTTLAGQTKTFIITTTGKRLDEQMYQGIVDSFVPL